jgi:ankyrin repeat protein
LSQSELFTFRELSEFFASSRVNSLEEFTRELDKFTVRKENLAQSDEFTRELEKFTMSLEEVTREIEKYTDEFKAQSKEEIVAKLAQSKEEIVANLANEFGILFEKHRRRDAEWYNDDAKYNSAQNEMMSMHRNAKAVPFLTMTMYQEWRNKQSFLRQADRMASFLRQADRMANRDRTRRVQNEENQSKRKQVALDICKAVGLVMEKLEERNEMSETPLIREAADGNTRNVHLLLEAGASIEAKQENVIGFTALNQAAYLGHKPVVKLLLRFGAQVDCIDAYGGTPLVAAALNGEFECVQVLIKGGANINHETTNGNTPLMKAAINGHVDCVKWLIIQGADIYKKNNTAQTAKDQAQESKKHAQKAATAAATAAEQLQQQPKEDQDSKIDEKNNKEQTANDQAKDHAQKAATAAEQLQQQPKKEQDSKERIKSKLTTNELIKLQQRYEKSIDNLTKVIRALDEGAKLIAKKNESGHHSFLEYLKDLDEKSWSQMKTELEGVNKKINEPLEGSDNGAMRVESWIEAAIGPKKATWSSAFLDK